ncbi:hypothetical protein HMPREF0863_02446 [Erysipelotrichaceae bacterium 5_2_54FAA]|nr:hypothetical protein HMPREF0863_02446 [Erysipelotrichaceae bacterium 5_2_54FAA]
MYRKIEVLMKKKGVTAYRLAKETGIPQSSISDWKRGRCKPSVKMLKILADYFGVDIKDLL